MGGALTEPREGVSLAKKRKAERGSFLCGEEMGNGSLLSPPAQGLVMDLMCLPLPSL